MHLPQDDVDLFGDVCELRLHLKFGARVMRRKSAGVLQVLQDVIRAEVNRDRADIRVFLEDRFGFFYL